MHRFWDLVEHFKAPGLAAHRPERGSGSTMGGWYSARGHYYPEQLGGLPVARFVQALNAEGAISGNFDPNIEGCTAPAMAGPGNKPLHTHAFFNSLDIFGHGKPTATACFEAGAAGEACPARPALPVVEGLAERALSIPWFKHDRADEVARFAAAYIKVARGAAQLL